MKEMEEPTARLPKEDEIQWYSNESKEARRFSWRIGIVYLMIGFFFALVGISLYLSSDDIIWLIVGISFQLYGILLFSISRYVDHYKLPYKIGIGTKGIYAECRKPKYDFFLPWKDIFCIRKDRFFRKGYEIPCCYGKKRTRDALPVTKEIGEILIRTRSSVISAMNKDFKIL